MAQSSRRFFVHNLASALLAGSWSKRALKRRATEACAEAFAPAIRRIVQAVWSEYSTAPPSFHALVALLVSREPWIDRPLPVRRVFVLPSAMIPRWNTPKIATVGQLAEWLALPIPELEWLADRKCTTTRQTAARLRHYVHRFIPRRRGLPRLLEIPKAQLKQIQRRILREILDPIPLHDAAHGFRRDRSVRTYALPHVAKNIVLRFDLRDFFPSVSAKRIASIFRIAGYPDSVARLLAGLCTTRIPEDVWGEQPHLLRLQFSHLPQGAPTSPALANLAANRLDVRLHALAQSLGASYTRYADDLAFSGDERLARSARRFQVLVAVIAASEGFELNFRKSRFMRSSVRQHLAGVVVNAKPNLRRDSWDELKAIFFNCVRHGPSSQNRRQLSDFRGHLLGRIAHVGQLNPSRGAKLRALFDRIAWT